MEKGILLGHPTGITKSNKIKHILNVKRLSGHVKLDTDERIITDKGSR